MRCVATMAIAATALSAVGGVLGFIPSMPRMVRTSAPGRTSSSWSMATAEAETAQYTIDNKAIGGPLTPISNSILVRVQDKDATSMGGVIIPDKAQEKPTEGEVIAMGPGKNHPETGVPMPLPCVIGDKVLYGEYDGTPVKYMGKSHQFVRDDNILFVYSGERMGPETVKMIRDQILVKLDPEETSTESGLLLGPKAEDTGTGPTTGEVVAVGPGRVTSQGEVVPMTVAKGDMVKFRNFAGSEVKFQEVDYRVIPNADVLAKW